MIIVIYLTMLEGIFTSSYIGRMLTMCSIIQAENLLYRFANFNKLALVITFFLKIVYMVCRVLYQFKDSDLDLVSHEDLPPLLTFITFFTYTVYIDDRVSSFILDTFSQIRETEQHWFNSLHAMPNGVIIYNVKEGQVTFQNRMVGQQLGIEQEQLMDAVLQKIE